MNAKKTDVVSAITGIPACIILSAITIAVIIYGQFNFTDVTGGLMIVRVIVSVIVFLIALISVAAKRHSLFINCIFFATMCFFLSQVWVFANYVWIEQEAADSIIEMISNVGLFMFIFSASYGALDSLADDGGKQNYKYNIIGMVAALIVAALFVVDLVMDFSVYALIYGIVLCPVVYISVKHLLIPDIENGYVRTLRHYYVVVLLMVIIKAADTLLVRSELYERMVVTLGILGIVVVIWLFPMAIKGVRKWTSL